MIISRSSKSNGNPCGDLYCVPRIFAMPLLVAVISTGDKSLSRARLSHEKHSMSSMWTSSTKSTPGTMVARPSSRHSATFASICSRTCAARRESAPKLDRRPPSAFSPGDESRRWRYTSKRGARASGLISPVSPANNARKPWALELITSISCNDTVCTTSFLFWSSPSGHCTNRTEGPIAS